MTWGDSEERRVAAFQALGDPTRRAIVALLGVRETLPGGEIARQFEMAWSSVSRHLGLLRDAGLVTATRDGRHILYSLNRTAFAPLSEELGRLAAPRVRAPMAGFTQPLRRCLAAAAEAARETGSPVITPGHLLLGLLAERNSGASAVLGEAGVTYDVVIGLVLTGHYSGEGSPPHVPMPDVASWRLMMRLVVVAARRRLTVIGPATLLDVLLDESDDVPTLLRTLGVDLDAMRAASASTPHADEESTRPAADGGALGDVDVASQLAALRGGVQELERLLATKAGVQS